MLKLTSSMCALLVFLVSGSSIGQPLAMPHGVRFFYCASAHKVALAGDFNQWQRNVDLLARGDSGCWQITKTLKPGVFQYKFIIDDTLWVSDSSNPKFVQNYNNTGFNSVLTVKQDGSIVFESYQEASRTTMNDEYPKTGKTLYLNIIWHQHQPLYLDPATDQLQGPWVRTHGTKDYYDMAGILEKYPNVHVTVNLTSSLLLQLEEYYIDRLKPFVNLKTNRVDGKKYRAKYEGKTDPWIDLALKSTEEFTERDKAFLLTETWNAFGISDVMIGRFPEYLRLRDRFRSVGANGLTTQEMREIKFWFYLAYFDPDILEGRMKLAGGSTIDLTDLIGKNSDGTYTLKKGVTEDDCNRIIAETYKVLSAIIPMHKKLMYRPGTHEGQIEIITTPFYHPILPLIYDSDLAKLCQPTEPMPSRFHFPEDAEAQVAKAMAYYKRLFGVLPTGMWPAEGSVGHDVVSVFGKQGIKWVATDEKILSRSKPAGQPKFYPYAIHADYGSKNSVVTVFRDTELSDKIGFVYQNYQGEDAADDFVRGILNYTPQELEPDRLLTVILDGENAWEWYRHDHDGKGFQNALYRKLSKLAETKQIVTVTVTEYLEGNAKRGVQPHKTESLPKLEWLWPGSWINANYDTWIGEDEENKAWEYLLTARKDLGNSGLAQPDPKKPAPKKGGKSSYIYRAWEAMYAAEGSDWFWWYGTDQTAPAGDKPFDIAFITHLNNVYDFARKAGGKMPVREFKPIIEDQPISRRTSQGTMAQSVNDLVTVRFQCDARDMYVRKSIFVAGNHEMLGNWTPNRVKLHDDGTNGDEKSGDSIWTLEVKFPAGTVVEYKYTNSGAEGSWSPGEEFSSVNRKITVDKKPGETMIIVDRFGKL